MTQSASPVPEDVGRMYDEFLGTGPMIVQNLHFGYWESPDEPFEIATDRLSDMVIARLGVGAGDRVLDVGCGVGAPTLRVARATGAELVGINVSRRQLACAEEAAADAGLTDRVGFSYADATRLEFEDSWFDAVYALESMIHMPDRGQVLGQIARVLRPGGRLVLTDFFARGEVPEWVAAGAMSWCHMTLADRSRYAEWAGGAGLEIVEDLDITEHVVRQTYLEFARLGDAAGVAPVEFGWSQLAEVPEIGYLLLTATRMA